MAKRKKKSGKTHVFLIFGLLLSAVFLPSSLLLAVGMMPTWAVALSDRTEKKSKVITVGALNLAGCIYFILDMWMQGRSLDRAITILSDPYSIIVMYSAAAVGYLLDWAVSGIVANVLYQKGVGRQNAIARRQQELIERWGEEVTGKLPLDEQGFPISSP